MIYETPWNIQDRVLIDGDKDMVVHVTAVLWRTENPLIEVSFIAQGQARTAWVEPWRLAPYEE